MEQGQNASLNLSYLNDIASGSTEFMVEMIDIFLEQTPLYFEQMNAAVVAKDWKTVADIAHKIKPTLAFMGADTAKDDMQQLEHDARTQSNLDDLEARYLSLKEVTEKLFNQLRDYKAELESQL